MKKKRLGVFLYNRLFDPLIQSNFWLYIGDYLDNNQTGDYEIFLITYEDSRFPLNEEQKKRLAEWQSKGLKWIALKWNPGKSIFSKSVDILQGFFAVLFFRLKGCTHFMSVASVAGSYLYLYYLFIRFDFFLYSFEPHSEYAVDNKMWNSKSIQFKIAHFLERKSAESAKVIGSGTRFMQQRLMENWKVRAKFLKIASVVNDKKFIFSQANRDATRLKLGFQDSTRVLFYAGKFGDLYYAEETAYMFKWLKECDSTFHFLIVTPNNDNYVIGLFDSANVDRKDYTIVHCDFSEIHHYSSAADFGIVAVPPGPSKKFISNIKVGEYLSAGLPYLITEGVSEDFLFALEKGVGVVVKEFKEEFIKKAYPQINQFLIMDKNLLREKCRTAGVEYRGFEGLNKIFKNAIDYLYS